jgi:hypothetical protein
MLERDVAVKMMHVDFTLDPTARARFEREAKAVARLQHRNVVTLHELGEVDGTPYIVMEFLGGKDLDTILRGDKPLTLGEKLDIVAQLCEGLGYAHDQGIVHRDIKPGNVRVLEDGTVKILDFGIARFATTTVTQSGSIMGTPSYMSPEQIMGKAVDGRSDLFSAGVLLYELLSGRKPFSGDSPTAVAYQIMHTEPSPVRMQVPELPEALNEIVSRALQKNPDDRYNRAAEMSADLQMVRLVLDPPLQTLETHRHSATSPLTLGKLHATQMRPRTGEQPTAVLETPMRATAEDEAAAAAGRKSAAKGGRGVMFAVAGLVLVLAAAGAYFLIGNRTGDDGGSDTGGATGPETAGGGTTGTPTGGGSGTRGAAGGGTTAAATTGSISFESQPPGAQIALNGIETGQVTPSTVPVALPASVQLSLRGYEPQTVALSQADLASGRKVVRLARAQGPVRVTVTGSYPFELVQGSRVISPSKTEHALTVQPGSDVIARSAEMFLRQSIGVDFRRSEFTFTIPEPGTLTVNARNETCPVFVDGTELGFPQINNRRIASGPHLVELRCAGARQEQRTTVPAGGRAQVPFRD